MRNSFCWKILENGGYKISFLLKIGQSELQWIQHWGKLSEPTQRERLRCHHICGPLLTTRILICWWIERTSQCWSPVNLVLVKLSTLKRNCFVNSVNLQKIMNYLKSTNENIRFLKNAWWVKIILIRVKQFFVCINRSFNIRDVISTKKSWQEFVVSF